MLEGIVGTKNLCYKHVGIFRDNTVAVSWTQRGREKSAVAGRLLRVLTLRKLVERESLSVAAHVLGDLNVTGDIPPCSFGYSKQWHRTNDYEFLSIINYKLPLPHQRYWQGFILSFTLIMKVISELGKNESLMGEWKQLRITGKSFGCSGVPIEKPLELNHTWRKSIYKPKQGLQQDFQDTCKKSATSMENRYKLEQCVQH